MDTGLVQTTGIFLRGTDRAAARGRPGWVGRGEAAAGTEEGYRGEAVCGPGLAGKAEYLLVVFPQGDLQDRLLREELRFSAAYGLDHRPDRGPGTLRNRPHLTLAGFQAGEEVEDTVIRWIGRICQDRTAFDLALNNYSGVPPHTVFLRVQDPGPVQDILRRMDPVDSFIRSSGWPAIRRNAKPYVSIAGGLTEQVYNKAMPDYSRRTFHGIFRVTELVLLRRRHHFDPCKTVNVFGLKS